MRYGEIKSAQKKLKTEKGERCFPQILNLGEGLRGKNNGGRKIRDQIKKLKFIHLLGSLTHLLYYFIV